MIREGALEVLHLAISGHRFGVGLGSPLDRLDGGYHGKLMLSSPGVDPVERIADERRVLGMGRHGGQQERQPNHQPSPRDHCLSSSAFFSSASASSFRPSSRRHLALAIRSPGSFDRRLIASFQSATANSKFFSKAWHSARLW
jgi:hypothetical protein